MGGAVELKQLAHLLRTGCQFAAEIAALRGPDAAEIFGLIDQAARIADRLDEIASRPARAGDDASAPSP